MKTTRIRCLSWLLVFSMLLSCFGPALPARAAVETPEVPVVSEETFSGQEEGAPTLDTSAASLEEGLTTPPETQAEDPTAEGGPTGEEILVSDEAGPEEDIDPAPEGGEIEEEPEEATEEELPVDPELVEEPGTEEETPPPEEVPAEPLAEEEVQEEIINELAQLEAGEVFYGILAAEGVDRYAIWEETAEDTVSGYAKDENDAYIDFSVIAVPLKDGEEEDRAFVVRGNCQSMDEEVYVRGRLGVGSYRLYAATKVGDDFVRSNSFVLLVVPEKPAVTAITPDAAEYEADVHTGALTISNFPDRGAYLLIYNDEEDREGELDRELWEEAEGTIDGLRALRYDLSYLPDHSDPDTDGIIYDYSETTQVRIPKERVLPEEKGFIFLASAQVMEYAYGHGNPDWTYEDFQASFDEEITRSPGSYRFHAYFWPEEFADLPVVWSSSDKKVATVDAAGNVNAIKSGQTTLRAVWTDPSSPDKKNPITRTAELVLNVETAEPLKTFKAKKTTVTVPVDYNKIKRDEPLPTAKVEIQMDKNLDPDLLHVDGESTETYFDIEYPEERYDPKTGIYTLSVFGLYPGVDTLSMTYDYNGTMGGPIYTTVQADGFYYDKNENTVIGTNKGKPIEGWAAWDSDKNTWTTGEKVATDAKYADAGQLVFYFKGGKHSFEYYDTTETCAYTLAGTDKKRFVNAVQLTGDLLADARILRAEKKQLAQFWGGRNTENALRFFCVDEKGVVQTGWQKYTEMGWYDECTVGYSPNHSNPDGTFTEYYFDPGTGTRCTSAWVPRGKGWTWVNADGEMKGGTFGDSTKWLTDPDTNFYRIDTTNDGESNPDVYFFDKNGVLQTGLQTYKLGSPGSYSTFKVYSDPATGIIWDSVKQGLITISGKSYFQHDEWGDGTPHIYTSFSEPYNFLNAETGESIWIAYSDVDWDTVGVHNVYCVDKNGVIQKDKQITIQKVTWEYDPIKDDFVQKKTNVGYYLDSLGHPYVGMKVLKGKAVYFTPELVEDYATATDVDMWLCAEQDQVHAEKGEPLQAKNIGKNATGGVYFYTMSGEKVVNSWIRDDVGNVYRTNKSGVLLTGPQKVELTPKNPEWFLFDPENGMLMKTYYDPYTPEEKYYELYPVGKKTYVYGFDGRMPLDAWVQLKPDDRDFVHTDKNGVLQTGIVTVTDPVTKAKQKVALPDNGILELYGEYDSYDPEIGKTIILFHVLVKDKLYVMTSPENPDSMDPKEFVKTVALPETDRFLTEDGMLDTVIKKGGQPASGFVTWEGEKYYCLSGSVLQDNSVKVSGKIYHFGETGAMQTGWVRLRIVIDVASFGLLYDYVGSIAYFDEKSGAMVTGWRDKTPLVMTRGEDLVVDDFDVPFTSGKIGKVYFLDNGDLARSGAYNIKGKIYYFNPDGTERLEEGWLDADENFYRTAKGTLASGRTQIGSAFYYFDPDTGKKETNVLRKCGSKWYYFNKLGRQSTVSPLLYFVNGELESYLANARIVFDKDGSVKQFISNTGAQLVGTTISTMDPEGQWEAYQTGEFGSCVLAVLDAKGKPVTGVVKAQINPLESLYPISLSVQIAGDGRVVDASTYAGDITLVKSGKSAYVMLGGSAMTSTEEYRMIPDIISFTGFSASEMTRFHRMMEIPGPYFGHRFTAIIQSDGSVAAGKTVQVDGLTYHTDKYGMPYESVSPFFKSGSAWRVNALITEATLYDISSSRFRAIDPVFKTDLGGKLLTVCDSDGNALDGNFIMEVRLQRGDELLCVASFKKGIPQTGKKTMTFYGTKQQIDIDPELGVGAYSFLFT